MEPINMESFGAFVAALRREHGLTQKELGERLYVTDKTVSKWERGQSLPSVSLLLPLAEILGVTVTELLQGERMRQDTLPLGEVEQLVTRSLSVREQSELRTDRRRYGIAFTVCCALSIAELCALPLFGCSLEQMSYSAVLVTLLMLFFGAWFCFFAPFSLPAYYDENRISFFSDGFFKISVIGLTFNNRNWPHIVLACRKWTLGVSILYPIVYLALELTGLNRHFLPLLLTTLTAALSIFLPIYIPGKIYE